MESASSLEFRRMQAEFLALSPERQEQIKQESGLYQESKFNFADNSPLQQSAVTQMDVNTLRAEVNNYYMEP